MQLVVSPVVWNNCQVLGWKVGEAAVRVGGRGPGTPFPVRVPELAGAVWSRCWADSICTLLPESKLLQNVLDCALSSLKGIFSPLQRLVSYVSYHVRNQAQEAKAAACCLILRWPYFQTQKTQMFTRWNRVVSYLDCPWFWTHRPCAQSRGQAFSPTSCGGEENAGTSHLELRCCLGLSQTLLHTAHKSDTQTENREQNWHGFTKTFSSEVLCWF